MENNASHKTYNLQKNWSGYNLSTFSGRFQHYLEVCNPLQSFKSTSTLKKYQSELAEIEVKADKDGNCQLSQDEYQRFRSHKLVLASSENPDNKVIIPWHMRSSAFIPTNLPIFVGMVLSPPTMFQTIFWQWTNQTYNAGFNYGNRNASSTQTTTELFTAYSKATAAAIGVAGGLRAATPYILGGSKGTLALMMNYIIGYCAVAVSSSVNVVAMREKELVEGIPVKDEETNEELGISKNAAKTAINNTVLSRIAYVVPMFFIPALWNLALTRAKVMPKQLGVGRVVLESLGVAIGLYIAMPVNCALFP